MGRRRASPPRTGPQERGTCPVRCRDVGRTNDARAGVNAELDGEAGPRRWGHEGTQSELVSRSRVRAQANGATTHRQAVAYRAHAPTRPYVPGGTATARSVLKIALPRAGTTPSYALRDVNGTGRCLNARARARRSLTTTHAYTSATVGPPTCRGRILRHRRCHEREAPRAPTVASRATPGGS